MRELPHATPYACLAVVTIACLFPIWAFEYFPSTDGPSHLENAFILREVHAPDRDYREFYRLNLDLVPNWFSHLALAALLVLFPPRVAEKVLLTGYVLFFILATLYFLRSVDRRTSPHVLLAAPLMYSFPLLMGFWNFCFSVPLMFLVLGFWWRRRRRGMDLRTAVGLNALLVLLYFCHLVSQVLALGTVIGFAAVLNRARVLRTLGLAASLAPSISLPVYFALSRGVVPEGDYALGSLPALIGLDVLVSLNPMTAVVSAALAGVFGVLMAATLFLDKLDPGGRGPRLRIGERDLFLLAALITAVAYLFTPQRISRGGFLHERLALYPFFFVLPWLTTGLGRFVGRAVAGIAVILTVAHLALLTERFAALNRDLDEFASGRPYVQRNDLLLPLSFDDRGFADSRISTFSHAADYYALDRGTIGLDNYEARSGYFPLVFAPGMSPFATIGTIEEHPGETRPDRYPRAIDFILVWRKDRDHPVFAWIREHYEVVHRQGGLTLFRRRAAAASK